jgi:N-methylhydantoinase A
MVERRARVEALVRSHVRARRRGGPARWRVGIDTGGTFTDLVAIEMDGRSGSRAAAAAAPVVVKVPSTPHAPEAGVLHALRELSARIAARSPEPRFEVVHGTTVATNAVLEGRGARVVLVTNRGFEDLIEIGRQARPDLYDLEPQRPAPLVARDGRVGVNERTLHTGEQLVPLTQREVARAVREVARRRPESIAVGLLHAYANPASERALGRALASLGVPISLSSQVAPLLREYERLSTTVANAALAPLCRRYLERLARALPRTRLFVLQSNGGWTGALRAARTPVRFVLSGPAGGLAAAARRLAARGDAGAVSLDMGGTSTDVGLVLGEPRRTDQIDLAGRPLLVDALEIHSIGAGGGSVLWIDDGGALRAGPRSAGADPGPACYGRGSEPCVTDAHVLLGRLPLTGRLGGAIALDAERSRAAFAPLARRLRRPPLAVAAAALAVVDSSMEQAIKRITLERGHDPRDLALFAFGGAGGLHACRLARRLEMRCVVVPPLPGATSAWGMATGDARRSESQGIVRTLDDAAVRELARVARRLVRAASRALARELGPGELRTGVRAACRYVGQSFELEVPFAPARARLAAAFAAEHERRFGFVLDGAPIQCVALHATASRPGLFAGARTPRPRRPAVRPAAPARTGTTPVRFGAGAKPAAAALYDRERLAPGMRGRGPAVVVEPTATTVVEPGFRFDVDATGCLVLTPED